MSMAGLQSIAMAVAHLEQGNHQEFNPRIPPHLSSSWDTNQLLHQEPAAVTSSSLPHSTMHIAPSRHGFAQTAPRMVSQESLYGGGALRSDTASPPTTTSAYVTSNIATALSPQVASLQVMLHINPVPVVSPSSSSLSTDIPLTMDLLAQARDIAEVELLKIQKQLPPPPSPKDEILHILEDDVLCGRGGETNHHPGNIKYRQLVKCYQPLYIISKRRDKPRIAQKIVLTVRQRGGRFLKKDTKSNTWRDVGNTKAREKTSQALREGAPELRNGKESEPTPTRSSTISNPRAVSAPSTSQQQQQHHPMSFFSQSQPRLHAAPPPTMGGLSHPQAAAAALFMAPRAPTLVEVSEGELLSSSAKRRRSSLTALAATCSAQAGMATLARTSSNGSSPAGTISASDEDVSAAAPKKSKLRGPRSKLLMRRLAEQRNEGGL
jgi:hypothetical protein